MKKFKPYQFSKGIIILLLTQAVVHSGCSQDQKKSDVHLLSMIISGDSARFYTGELEKNTQYKKVATEEATIKAIYAQKKKEGGDELRIQLKLSLEDAGAGFVGKIVDVIRWAKQSGIDTIDLVDLNETEQALFKLPAITWGFIDSLRMPSPLELKMPKDVEEIDISKIDRTAEYVLSVIGSGTDKWYCFKGIDTAGGKLYNRKEYAALLKQQKKQWGEKLIVLVRPDNGPDADLFIAALEEKSKAGIKNYQFDLPPSPPFVPRKKLTAEDFLMMAPEPPEPIEITTPQSVSSQKYPDDNTFLIEIKEDHSVRYSVIMKDVDQSLTKVDRPVTQNLAKIISDFEKKYPGVTKTYLVKSHPKTAYADFEQVIAALKKNNLFKYNLVTSENQ